MSLLNFNFKYDGGGYLSVADAKLADFSLSLVAGGGDRLTFSGPGHNIFATPMFTFGKAFEFYHGTTLLFSGRINAIPSVGTARSERISWEVVGPWYYLEQTPFLQACKQWDSGTSAEVTTYQSRAALGQNSTKGGAVITNGAVITEVLNYCLTVNPAAFTIGTIAPAVTFPSEEILDLTCAEVIRKMLRWSPDAVLSFDYSVSPPALNIRTPANLNSKSAPVADSPVHEFRLKARPDLVPACVAITYEQTVTVDNQELKQNTLDVYPADKTGRELNAIAFTCEISGSRSTLQKVECGTEAHAPSQNTKSWWTDRVKWLKDLTDADWTIVAASVDYENKANRTLAYEVRIGEVPDWLTGKHVRDAIITATVAYMTRDANNVIIQKWHKKKIEYHCLVTDLDATITKAVTDDARDTGKVYTHLVTDDAGETVPTGLAQAYYNSLTTLRHEGSLVFKRAECLPTDPMPGDRLTLVGGVAGAAGPHPVQKTTFRYDNGMTTVDFGPLPGYQFSDLLELQRLNRRRRIVTAGYSRADSAKPGARSQVTQQPKIVINSIDAGDGMPKSTRYTYPSAESPTKEIALDPESITVKNQGLVIKDESGKLVSRFDWIRFHS